MVEDLAAVCYPGINQLEKKHRVSILRAVRNAKLPDDTWWYFKSANYVKGVPYVLFNRLNLRSTGVADERRNGGPDVTSITDAEAEGRCFGKHSRTRAYILEDGPYPVLVEYYRAIAAKEKEHAEALWETYKALIHKVVCATKTLDGDIHPDFLRDCVTLAST